MNEKVPTFRKQLTPGGDTPARVEVPHLEVNRETRATPERIG